MPDKGSAPAYAFAELRSALTQIIGEQGVTDESGALSLRSHDIWSAGAHPAALAAAPADLDELSRSVAAINAAGFAIAPRGAGMSYTGGYVPALERTVMIDTARMDKILDISARDMTVTVEAGCTWSALNAALAQHGLRTPFWGPMSGLLSTVGGGVAQQSAMLGAGHYGPAGDSVVGLTIVLADGRILRTGTGAKENESPFFRHYGPDLTGLFCGDCGVFGIKAQITLRLIKAPQHEGYASFSFKSGREMLTALAEIARQGLAAETCAFDPGLTKVRMARASLAADVKTLGAVVAKQKSLIKGITEAAKIAMAGRDFIAAGDYPLHVICEGRSTAAVESDLAGARKIAADNGGQEIENTIAKVIRATPFPPLNSVLGPAAERWAPVHGVTALSKAADVFEAIEAVFAGMADRFAAEGVSTGYLFTSISTNAIIVEPVFYWPEERFKIHEAAMEPAHLAKLPVQPQNPSATSVVKAARAELLKVFQKYGCAHFQIGRVYPYRESRDAASWTLIEAIKNTLDSGGAINAGVLGLDKKPES